MSGSSPQVRGTLQCVSVFRQVIRFIPAGAGNTVRQAAAISQRPVHPRRCGEHATVSGAAAATVGSSPQVRGTRWGREGLRNRYRFIPAGAGNTGERSSGRQPFPVHPRRCGEHAQVVGNRTARCGSSPQVRGTPCSSWTQDTSSRFIPAGAGNTSATVTTMALITVHPRRCGEHGVAREIPCLQIGSSPQVRGTHSISRQGKPLSRFIPAGAGNTQGRRCGLCADSVHPRRCGEHILRKDTGAPSIGSSPQVRGTLKGAGVDCAQIRFIPAGAGNTRRAWWGCGSNPVHPRRCGEHALGISATEASTGSSPQVRGTRPSITSGSAPSRFIPAGAGNTAATMATARISSVHPRRCGEHAVAVNDWAQNGGSSPQVRGTQQPDIRIQPGRRFIPAGAGNTR